MEIRNIVLWLTSLLLAPVFYSLAHEAGIPLYAYGIFISLGGLCMALSNVFYRLMYKPIDYEKGYIHGYYEGRLEKRKYK